MIVDTTNLFIILGEALYARGLSRKQQTIVIKAQYEVCIDYIEAESPAIVVFGTVRILAVGPPNADGTRLSASLHRFPFFRCSIVYDLPVFVSHYCGLAANHLQNANASLSFEIGSCWQSLRSTTRHCMRTPPDLFKHCKVSQCRWYLISSGLYCKSYIRLARAEDKSHRVFSKLATADWLDSLKLFCICQNS